MLVYSFKEVYNETMSEAAFENPETTPPIEPTPHQQAEKALSAVILYRISSAIMDQPETFNAVQVVGLNIKPPLQRPRGREDFEEPGVTDYYETYQSLASVRNPATGKFEPMDHADVMKCTQTIWDRMNSTTETLTAMLTQEAVSDRDINVASWVLKRVAAILKTEEIAFEPDH